jgi:uncharacterized membrane protein
MDLLTAGDLTGFHERKPQISSSSTDRRRRRGRSPHPGGDDPMTSLVLAVTLATALGCGVSGGVLFGFSSFVLPALRSLPPGQGIAAMQAINLVAPRSWFLVPLLGSALGSLVTGTYAVLAGPGPGRGLLLLGAAAGLSVLAITAGYHIPRNNNLATVDPTDPAAAARWVRYATEWARWNHVRSAAGMLAALALVAGAWLRSTP